MHILALPKWYPNEADVQLGSFIRKQFEVVSEEARVSVVFIAPAAKEEWYVEQHSNGDLWELRAHFKAMERGPRTVKRVVNFLRYCQTMSMALAQVQRERGDADLTHVHVLTAPALVAWWLKRTRAIPYIVTEHGSMYINGIWRARSAVAKAVDRWLMRGAAKVTAVSPHLAAALQRNGLGKAPVVVPNVVPGADRPLPATGPSTDFLMVADLVDSIKNISGVVRAFGIASAGQPEWQLTIIGDGPDAENLRALSCELNLQERINWPGRMENSAVLDLMAGCGCVIVNSNVETFSIVTGEALALGKPVIATRCGGPEGFIHESNGLLIAPKDNAALAAAMLEIRSRHGEFHPQEQRDSLGGAFTASAVAQQYFSIYRAILGHG